MISVVVPVYNEEETLEPLAQQLMDVLEPMGQPFELIFVDDGSTDRSSRVLEQLRQALPERVHVIRFPRNLGKCAALVAGFRRARGEILFTLDADLQDDPSEIPQFLTKLSEGYDLVSGWKVHRQDPWSKRWPSKLFNAVVARLTGVALHDVNCGFKCYRRDVVQQLELHGRLYRFIPILAAAKGFQVGELPIRHRPRTAGHSKFGATRLLDGAFDLLTVLLLTRYLQRPLHLLGLPGVVFGLVGLAICGYLSVLWLNGVRPIGTRPLFQVGILCLIMSIQFVSIGLLGEMLAAHMRQHQTEHERKVQERTKEDVWL